MITILSLTANWCPGCKRMKLVLFKLAEKYDVEIIDVDQNMEIAEKYGVKSLPTTIILKEGQQYGELMVGAKPYSFVVDKIKQAQ